MDKQEFINDLSNGFKDGNEILYRDLLEWIDRNKLTEFQLIKLYQRIKENYKYKTFPSLAEIIKYFNEDFYSNSPDFDDSPINEHRKIMSKLAVDDLFKILHSIHLKRQAGQTLTTLEIDVFHNYDELYSEYLCMKDMEKSKEEIKAHLTYVYNCIHSKKKFTSMYEQKQKVYFNV